MTRADILSTLPPVLKHAFDALATVVGIACALVSAVNIVSVLAGVWWVLRIYETATVQRWLGKDRKP